MTVFAIFLLKSSVCLALFYGFYRLAFHQEQTLKFNRAYLLTALAVSLALPALSPTVYVPEISSLFAKEGAEEPVSTYYAYYILETVEAAPEAERIEINWAGIVLTGYIGMTLVFLGCFLFSLTRIVFRILDSERIRHGRFVYVLTDAAVLPHSFLHFVFMNRDDYESGSIRSEIIRHECIHGDQWHTLDILFVEAVKIFFWFHPAVWLLKRSMQLNHEYLADRAVLREYEIKAYQKTLVDYAYRNQALSLVSNFNYSFTKKRLIMMTRMKTNKWRFGSKLALLLPVLMTAFLISANCQTKAPEAPAAPTPATAAEAPEPPEAPEAPETRETDVKVKEELKLEMEAVKKEQEAAKNELEAARKEVEKNMKVIKEKKVILDAEGVELEEELQRAMEQLQEELEDLDINMEELMEKIRKGIDVEFDESFDGGSKRIKIVTGGKDGHDFQYDFDWKFEGMEEGEYEEIIEKVVRAETENHKVMFIGDDGEVIEFKGDGPEQHIEVIHKDHPGAHQKMIWVEAEGDDDGEYIIRVNTGGEEDEIKHIIKQEIRRELEGGDNNFTIRIDDGSGKKTQKIYIVEDGEDIEWIEDDEREVEVIVIREDGKSKKKKKRK